MPERTLPVLLLIFNRPDTTRQVVDALSRYKPHRLYVAADGPRRDREEADMCEQARKAATLVNWDCEIKTLFRNENLGLRTAVSTAIDWFFEHEEKGIILEDDCVPSQSFFAYCEVLLEYYRDDMRVMAISGNNFQRGRRVSQYSYFFSKHPHCWGWATWRRAWRLYDRNFATLGAFEAAGGMALWSDGSKLFEERFRSKFQAVREGRLSSWYYCWTYSCWANNGLTCLPAVNLVQNIGFGVGSTHTRHADSWMSRLTVQEMSFPLSHPPVMVRDQIADRDTALMVEGINDPDYIKWPWIQTLLNPLRGAKHRLTKALKRSWQSLRSSNG